MRSIAVQLYDSRMAELLEGFDFRLKSIAKGLVSNQPGRNDLDRSQGICIGVNALVDGPHTAPSQRAPDSIGP